MRTDGPRGAPGCRAKLAELKEQGAIDEAEYATLKAKILA